MAISTPSYDPASTAAALAEKYVSGQQQQLTAKTNRANATDKALTELRTALTGFQTALSGLTGSNKTFYTQSALFSDTSVGTATASSTAAAGTYSFHVARLASAHQVSHSLLEDSTASGSMVVKVGGTSLNVSLAAAGADGKVTPREIAAAINTTAGASSLVTASVVSTGTNVDGDNTYELVLTAKNTGTANKISIEYGGATPAAAPFDNPKELVTAENALIRIGSTSGTEIEQPTNTFNVIDGVTMTFTKTTSAPVTLTVATDAGKTRDNVQAFVDAYNKVKATVDALAASGDPSKGIASGAFAGDSGVRSLRDRLVSLMRPTSGDSLAAYGITANRQGTLSLDTTRLNKALEENPIGLDTLIGSSTSTPPTGLAGALDTYVKSWTSGSTAQITTRKDAVSKMQLELTGRQDSLDKQYNSAYQRYLMQFTQLQALQSQMSNNSSMFDALFSSDKD
jgi:flagellar hook-associated protein 2